ncbi:transposase [Synechocystis sp. PCC 7339]|uniref:RNA-guided endonuclease InsQ/TnpB family protein n=1 Tax=unclassified Synechocystis TaxID=2640012 RepID=UPI001BAFA1E0|nr:MULTISPECIES: RNA-guided endonuclease TnpB family protein [unclassified Synechocystis]QUS61040.1 IS200/IS605 family element transposase accessory protein TnpB [Synechocystis sp. PCC 7338]UAJ73223.1 transposase [Synechocystis sp. PCC 7339]
MEKSHRYRFYPTPEQENLLRRTLGCVRLVYNKALHERTQGWYERQERIGYNETSLMLTGWKKEEELDFLNEVSSVPLQQGLRNLQTAFTNFFAGRAKYPNFKKKHQGGSAEFTKAAFRFRDGQVYLAKCSEPLDIRWSRQISKGCEPTSLTVRLHPSGRWHIAVRFDDLTIKPLPVNSNAIGIDLGVTSLIATSNGDKIANPKQFRKHHRRLNLAQKRLARKQKGSKNREKARRKVAKIHLKITDSRKDFFHKLTTQLVRENQTIAVEDLSVKNMVKNRKLAFSISDSGWGEFVRQLDYKCRWYGRNLVKIDRWFPSSKRCSSCGHIVDKMPLNIRSWQCPSCGTTHDRDINAGKNILAAGLAVSVCGATVRPEQSKSVKVGAMKQKPKS